MLKQFFRRFLAPLTALLALGSAVPADAKAPAAAHPALWAVSDAGSTVYLFGTIHLLPDHYQWRTAKFDQALASSNQLVIETIVDMQHPQSFVNDMFRLGFAQGLPPITQRVPPAAVPLLRETIAKSGIPEKQFDQMKTWAAAFNLLGVRFREIGLKAQEGPEQTLREEFTAKNKPIGELETNAEQLGFFDRLPEPAQRKLLQGSIEGATGMGKEFNQMLDSWARGDVAGIAVSFNHDLADSPELRQSLLKQRNANWSKWIEQHLHTPGAIMVAVGAGHLAGKDSVISMLQKDGYRVTRVQ